MVLTFTVNFDLCTGIDCSWTKPIEPKDHTNFEPKEDPPFVLYTSLPLAGSEILHHLFKNTSDFFNTDLPGSTSKFMDPCAAYSCSLLTADIARIKKWLRALAKNPKGILKNLPKRSQNALPSVRLGDPGWSMKFSWLRKVVGSRMRAIIVVRDPRGWVNSWLREMRADRTLHDAVHESVDAIANIKFYTKKMSHFADEFQEIHRIALEYENDTSGDIAFLSYLWATQLRATFRRNYYLPKEAIHYVHFEDLINKPKKTAQRLFQFIGVPLSPAAEHRVLTAVKTAQFSLGRSREVVGARTVTAWERELSSKDAHRIKDICAKVMGLLRYDISDD